MTQTQPQPQDVLLTPEERRVRRAHLVVSATVLAIVAATYLGVVARLAADLPQQLAVHFGLDGASDGWLDRTLALVSFGLLGIGLPVLLLVVLAAGQWWRGSSARATTAFVGALSAGLVALFVVLLWSQRGLEEAAEVRMSGVMALWPLAVALGAGLLGAVVLPRNLPQPEALAVEPIDIAPSDRVSWFGQARSAQVLVLALLAAVLLVVGASLVTGVWWLWLVVLLLLLLFPATTAFRVTVDRDGLTWRSALGVPRGRVPLADVAEVSVVQVRPGDFGGYGIRSVPGATAIVTRHGSALQVRRVSGRRLVLTVDDPLTAAGVLEGLRRRG